MEKTHIATICKLEKVTTPTGDILLVCIPLEFQEGIISDERKFIDVDGTEFLPAYDAFLRGEKVGYIFDVSFKEMLGRGCQALIDLGYEYSLDGTKDDIIIQNYRLEYEAQMQEMTCYYKLDEVIGSVLYYDMNEDFYSEYRISIDRDLNTITTKFPKEFRNPDDFIRELVQPNDEKSLQNEIQPTINITRLGLIEHTKKYVIAQDAAIPLIVSAIYNPLALDAPKMIQNILLYGPTGVGKTYILETIAKKLGLPYFYKEISDFSSTGYVGSSVEDLYIGLYNAAGKDIKKLQRGAILFLDEFDKLIIDGESSKSDIKSQVYSELLALYHHGGVVTFRANSSGPLIEYNKEKLIIITAGSFVRMNKQNKQIGFAQGTLMQQRRKYYTKKDFERFGVPVELLGRLDLCIPLDDLSEEDLYQILTCSLDSPYLVATETLKLKGITLNIPESALRQMAHKAYTLQTGARSLRGIFEFAISEEMNHIVDMIDSGTLSETTFDVSFENITKRLERYYG